jgi:predicted nucleic acid-binding Zn ribbon protein
MPTYEYKCRACKRQYRSHAHGMEGTPAPCCDATLGRVYSVSIKKSFREHWNAATGQYVTSSRQHADLLKAQSEAQTLRTGIETRYVPVDPADAKAVYGITDEAIEEEKENRAKLSETNPSIPPPQPSAQWL